MICCSHKNLSSEYSPCSVHYGNEVISAFTIRMNNITCFIGLFSRDKCWLFTFF